jgi:hypothetical protein
VDKLVPRNDGLSVSAFSVSAALMFMLTVGTLAVSGPARRALRIDATEALRENSLRTEIHVVPTLDASWPETAFDEGTAKLPSPLA